MTESLRENETAACEKAMDEARHFLDIPLKITIQLGSRNIKIREILQLKQNSIMELAKSAGENIDVYVNGRLVAFGEVLELEGSAGIRLTDIQS